MLIRQKYHAKDANFYVASAITRYNLHVDGFTGNLDDPVKEHKMRPYFCMLLMTLILKPCRFLLGAG